MAASLLLSHPSGNQFVRAALAGFLEAGLLGEFHTSIACFPGNAWDCLGALKGGSELRRRAYDERLRALTVQTPWRELGRMVAQRAGWRNWTRHETGYFSVDAVYQAQDRAVAASLPGKSDKIRLVFAYEDGALETFRAAAKSGMKRLYDLPIAYWETAQRLLREEAERLPAWEPTLGGTRDSGAKLARKAEELALADAVICPSQFVADSLPAEANSVKRIIMAPFGSPPSPPPAPVRAVGGKLRVLFAGSMTQRKGLGDLLAAVKSLQRSDVELVVMGSPQVPMEFYREQFAGFTYEAGRPHLEVLKLMESCDVFCLPSIVEGRALVMQEAMSRGLPVIITANTGGEDLVEEGVTGFLVPIRRPDKIAEKIAWLADHRAALPEMSRAAQAKAAQITWAAYAATLVTAAKELAA